MGVLLIDAGHEGSDLGRVSAALGVAGSAAVVTVAEQSLCSVLPSTLARPLALVVIVTGREFDAGHRAIRAVRALSSVPVTVVSRSHREADEVIAFSEGCDDYMYAESSPQVMIARLRSRILRGREELSRLLSSDAAR